MKVYTKCIKSKKYYTVGEFYRVTNSFKNEYVMQNDEGYFDLVSKEYFEGLYAKNPQGQFI